MSSLVLVTAKAPVPGRAKTRLAATVGPDVAADLAAAALLDTLAAVSATTGVRGCLALEGRLGDAARGEQIARATRDWQVFEQRGTTFGERLVAAHADAGPGPVAQIGMDTPQVTPALLSGVLADLAAYDACLGPADDGGWWVLARRDPTAATPLAEVVMSSPTTYADTRSALVTAGHRVADAPPLRDVDTIDDAIEVARLAPRTLFAEALRAWQRDAREAR